MTFGLFVNKQDARFSKGLHVFVNSQVLHSTNSSTDHSQSTLDQDP